MWFTSLTGFREESGEQVRANIDVDGERMISKVNGRELICGKLEIPTLRELRERVAEAGVATGKLSVREVVADAQALHADSGNAGAIFQVASQFNLLEMLAPSVTPDEGVDGYDLDLTQGPACAIACGAGTIYRNYFAEFDGHIGQSAEHQIDCLKDLGDVLRNPDERLWEMQNGYAFATESGLKEIAERLANCTEAERDDLRQELRIGVHWDTQVTLGGSSHTVSQVYGSAMPVSYSPHSRESWAEFAKLILEASYEATFLAAVLNTISTGNNSLYLTLIGGGVFGNDEEWILAAIERSLKTFSRHDLNVAIVSHGGSKPGVQRLVG